MMITEPRHASIQPVRWPTETKLLRTDTLRLDLLHPAAPGNKWFKLRYYIEEARARNITRILTWGGAWSNHLHATAATCKEHGLEMIALVRGEEPREWSSTLQDLRRWGTHIHFLSREQYSRKQLPSQLHTGTMIEIPEGGAGEPGIRGAMDIALCADLRSYTHIACAVGTGTTAEGLHRAMHPGQTLLEIPVLKGWPAQGNNIESQPERIVLNDFHFGGYAKHRPELLRFMNDLYHASGIPTDVVYTGKLFYAMHKRMQQGFFSRENKLLIVHSGGLQGNRSLDKGTLIF